LVFPNKDPIYEIYQPMSKPTPPICNYEGSDYQQQFWEAGGRAYEDAAEGIALKRLLPVNSPLLGLGI